LGLEQLVKSLAAVAVAEVVDVDVAAVVAAAVVVAVAVVAVVAVLVAVAAAVVVVAVVVAQVLAVVDVVAAVLEGVQDNVVADCFAGIFIILQLMFGREKKCFFEQVCFC